MNRRTFLFRTSTLIVSACLLPSFAAAAERDRMSRVGMGTVLFRSRFRQTKPKGVEHPAHELTLLDVPAYYRERFGVTNLEFWSYHFESLEPAYLGELKERIRASGSTLVNIQVDTSYNLASAKEDERLRSLAHVKQWIDAAALLGSTAIRINPGNGPVENSIRSMREVNAYTQSKGLPLLIENHFGIEMDPDVHLRIRREAGPENIYTLPDFGNYSDAVRFAALEKILPYAYLVSAKVEAFKETNGKLEHVSFDFDRCMQLCERAGFKGIYSVEQWSREEQNLDYERVADWLIEHVKANI